MPMPHNVRACLAAALALALLAGPAAAESAHTPIPAPSPAAKTTQATPNLLNSLPDNDKIDYAFGAFQRGYYLTAFASPVERAQVGDANAQSLIG